MKEKLANSVVELLLHLPGSELLFFSFTKEQRDWFIERDEGMCQFPVSATDSSYTPCGREEKLEVHHVIPQRYSKDVLHKPESEIDVPENGITLCNLHHQKVVHPDMALALANYHKDKGSFKKAFSLRDELVKQGLVYWNNAWDGLFTRIVQARNRTVQRPFPQKGKPNGR